MILRRPSPPASVATRARPRPRDTECSAHVPYHRPGIGLPGDTGRIAQARAGNRNDTMPLQAQTTLQLQTCICTKRQTWSQRWSLSQKWKVAAESSRGLNQLRINGPSTCVSRLTQMADRTCWTRLSTCVPRLTQWPTALSNTWLPTDGHIRRRRRDPEGHALLQEMPAGG